MKASKPPNKTPNIASSIDRAVRFTLALSASLASTSALAEPAPPAEGKVDISEFNFPERPDYLAKITVQSGCAIKMKTTRSVTPLLGDKPCTEALDPSACEESFKSMPLPEAKCPGGAATTSHDVFVATVQDRIVLLTTPKALVEVLGDIDTPAEALLVCQALGDFCEGTPVAKGKSHIISVERSISDCPVTVATVALTINRDATITEKELSRKEFGACAGRLPEGFVGFAPSEGAGDEVGAFFGRACQLERAAVAAFEVIANELEAFGAPADLIARAREAASDEVEHTDLTRLAAQRYGANPGDPLITERPLRDLWSFALDNATEGCVRETFGVAFARYQSAKAQDPDIATLAARIADDEARHAQLSWDIATWCAAQLDPSQVLTLRDVQRSAVASLRSDPSPDFTARLGFLAGVPEPDVARALIDELSGALWAPPDTVN